MEDKYNNFMMDDNAMCHCLDDEEGHEPGEGGCCHPSRVQMLRSYVEHLHLKLKHAKQEQCSSDAAWLRRAALTFVEKLPPGDSYHDEHTNFIRDAFLDAADQMERKNLEK